MQAISDIAFCDIRYKAEEPLKKVKEQRKFMILQWKDFKRLYGPNSRTNKLLFERVF